MAQLTPSAIQRRTAFSPVPTVHRADPKGQLRVDITHSPRRRQMAANCAKPPFVMARQTSLHHRSNQTRNRHGWRCPAERKLRLGFRQYGERYLWFESISLHQPISRRSGGCDPLLVVRAPNDARSCEGIADRSIAPREAPLIAGLSLSFHQAEFFELGVCEGALFLLSAV